MQTKSKETKGYITIYLALMFGVALPFLFALIEGVAAGSARLQSELVADLAVDSAFAEYHKELLRQYGLFFIDDSYGTQNGSISLVEKRVNEYLSYNTLDEASKEIPGFFSFQKLKRQYLEIEEVAFATDEKGKVWKAQAIQFMKDQYGIGYLQEIKDAMQTVDENALLSTNVENTMQQYRNEVHDTIERREQELEEEGEDHVDKNKQEGPFSYDNLMNAIDEWKGQGVLTCVMPENQTISQMAFAKKGILSERYEKGACNVGRGLDETIDPPTGLDDELLYGEYILKKYGNFLEPKEDSYLSYEVEYILFGYEKDMSNLRECAERLLLMREASNYLYLTKKDPVKKAEVRAICTAICSFCLVPEMSEALTQITLGLWSYGESILDVRCLLKGGKVSLMKDSDEWNLSLSGLLRADAWRADYGYGSKKKTALSYQDYLRIFLGCSNPDQKVLRSMDMVELDIRKTAGNTNFRLDQCIDTMLVSFGFTDQYKHDYVITKKMRY